MNLAEDLKARGLVEHVSADLDKILSKKRTIYLGVDPSSDSMQAGNLVVVLLMKRLADAGHHIILLVGGGTGMIGDPRESGERTLADVRVVARNKKALRTQMQSIIGTKVTLVDNADWLLKIKLVDFLRDIGKHFTVNELVKRDIIKRRLETPDESISYTEFAYSLLQGYDYMVLNQKYACDVQVGGTDQWTNLLSGVELIRRKLGKEAFAITVPLVTDAAGKKFGKSEGNAIWLAASKTSPFAFYQFWLNQPDDSVEKFLKMYTFMPLPEITALMSLHQGNPGKREAQKRLAKEVTQLVHGAKATGQAQNLTEQVFTQGKLKASSKADLAMIEQGLPTLRIRVSDNLSITDAVTSMKLVESKSEARRLIAGKGISLDGEAVTDADMKLTKPDWSGENLIIRRGKQAGVLIVEK